MRFCENDADFPVFEVWTTVTYQTPRRAMVMERMLLRLAAELDPKAAERGLPLAELFAQWLCVPHALAMMDQCFADMRQQGLLVMEPALEGFGAATLADVKVDPLRGKALIETGKLPGRTMTEVLLYAYDPIRGRLVGLGTPEGREMVPAVLEGVLTLYGQDPAASKPPTPRADAKRFAGLDLSGEVRLALHSEKHDWRKEDTEVENVETVLMHEGWKTRKIQVDIDLNGRVSVSVPGCKATEKWLRALPAAELWQEFLEPVFGTQRRPGLSRISLTETCTVQPQGSPSIAEGLDGKTAMVVEASNDLPVLLAAPAGQLHVRLVKDAIADVLEWSDHERGATVVIGGADFNSEFVGLVKRGGSCELQTDHILPLHLQGLAKLAEVRVVERGLLALNAWTAVAEDVEVIAKQSGDPQDLAILAAWLSPAQVLAMWAVRVADLPVQSLSDAGTQLRRRMEGIAGQTVPAAVWEEAMVRCAKQSLQQEPAGQSPQQVAELAKALQRLGPRLASAVESELLAKARPPAAAKELRLLRDALPSRRLPQSEDYFNSAVVAELMDEAFAPEALLSDSSPLEAAASTARRAADLVARDAGCALGALLDDDAMAKTLPQLQPAVLEHLQQWSVAVGQLRTTLAGHLAGGTRLEIIDSQLRSYRTYLDLLTKGDASKTPLVFDTNAFLHHPKVLAELRPSQVAVVPQQVVAELDRKKRDPQLAEAATRANAEIHRRREQIQFEEGDLHLLPSAYRSSADDQILSVVMQLKWRKAVLVTSDKNLKTKAKSLGIDARTPAELWPALKSEPAQGAKAK